MPRSSSRRTRSTLALGAAALALLGCARRTPEHETLDETPGLRQLASPSAFDLVATSGGAVLVWASGSPGALHVEGFDTAGRRPSGATVTLEAGSAVADVAALALGAARVIAWSEVGTDGRRLRAAWLPEHGAARPFDLGSVGGDTPSGRGGVALAASGQGARLLARGGPTPCTSAGEPPCSAFQFFALDAESGRSVGFPLAVPSPCAAHAAQLVPGSGGWASGAAEPFEYAVCSEARSRSALTIFSIRPSPAYAAAEEVFAGCTPLGAARFAGQSAFVAQCAGERQLARLDGEGAASVESLEPRGLVCSAAGANLRFGTGWLRLAEPMGNLELLLGDDLAPPGARAIWTGAALLVAHPMEGGALALARHACRGTALVELTDAPDANLEATGGWQGR